MNPDSRTQPIDAGALNLPASASGVTIGREDCPHDRPQQSPRRPESHRHRQDRPQGAFSRRRDARHDGDPRHAGLDPRDRALARRPYRLRFGLRRRRLRQAHQSGPPHRGDRPALEVADARDRPRRHLRAARRDDRRRRHGLVLGRARQRGAGDRSRRRQGAQDRRRRHRPLGGGQPFRPARCSRRSSRITWWPSTSPAVR